MMLRVPPPKGTFWDQPTDEKMYEYLLVRVGIGLIVDVLAWFVGNGILRMFLHH